MKKIFFIAIFTIMQSAISSAQNDCGRGYGLSGDNGCIPCANSNQIVHDGICYSCAEKANMSISKCKWDEQQNKAIPVCVSGTALNEEGTACIKCSADNQIVHNGKCYTCGGISNALTCKWDEQQNKAIPVCVSGTVLNEEGTACINCSDDNHIVINGKCHSCSEPDIICNKVQNICDEGKALNTHGYCISCTGKNQVIRNGQCLACSSFITGCNSCSYRSSDDRIECKSCSQGTLVDGECKVTQTKTCDSGTYLTPLNTCIASCPLNYFANNKTGKCEKKPEGCNEFDENGDCIGKCWDDFLKRGNECVYSAEGCGSGFDINEALKECILKTIYTMQEADEATSNDNENMIEWIFE